MTIQEFISTISSPVDVDHAYGPQCWDLVELYAEQNGVPKEPWAIPLGPDLSAYEAWTVTNAHMQQWFDRIPAGQQQPGDIMVYGAHPGGPEGHIAIYVGDGVVFEQNADPDGSGPHLFKRPITWLIGALRIKQSFKGAVMAAETTNGEVPINDGDFTNIAKDFGSKDPDTDKGAFNKATSWNNEYYGAISPRIKQLVQQNQDSTAAANTRYDRLQWFADRLGVANQDDWGAMTAAFEKLVAKQPAAGSTVADPDAAKWRQLKQLLNS